MNLLSHLSNVLTGRKVDDVEDELSPEEIEAQAKAERIKFHRERVRNGPVSFKMMTNGQVRRAEQRERDRQAKKAFRVEVRNHFERLRVAAGLRGHLQTVGLIPFIDGHEATLQEQVVSTAWIQQRYGAEVAIGGKGTGHVSFRKGDVIDGLRNAARFYEAATGQVVRVPADFVPAIYEDEEGVA